MKNNYDAIIVGTGAAGLFAALSLPTHYNVLMISKDTITNSDSYLAQGGISTLFNDKDYDTYFEDTIKAGRYENNKKSVEIMINSSRKIINELIQYGIVFDIDEDGDFDYTREGGHSICRILHYKDATGKEIVTKLLEQVEKRTNIELLEYTTMLDIINKDNICYGIVLRDSEDNIEFCYSKTVILATGGLGGLFKNSTNFSHIAGDSFAIALKNNILLENINYIQIHPTVLYSKRKGRRFLISESVRGEGAVLLNEKKERFVDELLPRDIVTKAICEEMEKYNVDHVYLRLNNMTREETQMRFPGIFEHCLEEGYDLSKDDIPVTPAQHYLMGGIKTNQNGETSMKGLYAVGETACNGVHGANRLASNSLLESLVFGERASQAIVEYMSDGKNFINTYKDYTYKEINYKKIVMDEIKRKDEEFYDKWCNNEN